MNTPTPRPGWIAQVQGHGFDLAWEQSLKSPFDPVCERIPHGDGTVIYREKVTGARPDRRELNRMLGRLAPGDVVAVTRIDRLARSTFDLFGIVKRVADTKAQFRSLAEPWADTGTSTGRLMLAVLGGLADCGTRPYPHAHGGRTQPGRNHAARAGGRCHPQRNWQRPTMSDGRRFQG
jgi:DNA invertase Pin-like site-specific DNA recombinase